MKNNRSSTSDIVDRMIVDYRGQKVPCRTKSINITLEHHEFLKSQNKNLSALVREFLDLLIERTKIKGA